MAIEYKWGFNNPDCVISKDGMNEIVQKIHWNLTGTDGEFSGYFYDNVTIPEPSPEDFTPFNELTEEWFITQVEANYDMAKAYGKIEAQIEGKKNPVMSKPNLPFSI